MAAPLASRCLPLLLAALLVAAIPAQASHVACPPDDCMAIQPAPVVPFVQGSVHLDAFRATIQASAEMAETRLGMDLSNPSGNASEATLSFPMPGGATLLGFNLTAEGRVLEGRVAESQQAEQEYRNATEQGKDAVLLKQASDRELILTIDVPAGANRTLSATYVEWLDLAGGQRIYRLPLSQLPANLGRIDLHATVDGVGLHDAVAPRFPLELDATPQRIIGDSSRIAPGPLQDLVLAWGVPTGWQGDLVASTASGWGEGAAVACLSGGTPLPRDIVFVLDRSGSMAGPKITEARASLRAVLPTLLPDDHYDIVHFSSDTLAMHGELQAATGAAVQADQAAVAAITEGGGTDLDSGLQHALTELNAQHDDRLPMIVLLTDGLPTVGVTEHQQIIERFVAANARHARLHIVPIGLDADYTFLADLALRSGGTVTALDPADGDLAFRLERLYDIVGHSLVRDIQVTFTGLDVTDVRPRLLPDLAEDRCLRLLFRANWTGSDDISFRLNGTDTDGPVSLEFTITRPEILVHPAVSALWGRAQVDDLLMGEHAGTVTREQIVENATAYRQLSPYTSWVIVDSVATTQAQHDAAGVPYDLAAGASASSTAAARMAPSGASTPAPSAPSNPRASTTSTPGPTLLPLLVALMGLAWVARRGRR